MFSAWYVKHCPHLHYLHTGVVASFSASSQGYRANHWRLKGLSSDIRLLHPLIPNALHHHKSASDIRLQLRSYAGAITRAVVRMINQFGPRGDVLSSVRISLRNFRISMPKVRHSGGASKRATDIDLPITDLGHEHRRTFRVPRYQTPNVFVIEKADHL